jgi:hypothetical protein
MTDNQSIVFNYGRYYELRKRTLASSPEYYEYDELCLALFRELRDVGIMSDSGDLLPDYEDTFLTGRDSAMEY